MSLAVLSDGTVNIASPMLGILSQIETEFNWLPITPFLHVVYMHGTRLTFGKAFVRKQYAILKFFREDSKIDFFNAKRLGVGGFAGGCIENK